MPGIPVGDYYPEIHRVNEFPQVQPISWTEIVSRIRLFFRLTVPVCRHKANPSVRHCSSSAVAFPQNQCTLVDSLQRASGSTCQRVDSSCFFLEVYDQSQEITHLHFV
ncbi:uncharacterized protein V6R79_012859 [Siganus canaliculatus]